MSSPRVRELEKKGIVFNISKPDLSSKIILPYECFVCGCKLRSEGNAITHSNNPYHIQQFNRFNQFFNIVLPLKNGKVKLLCKFCNGQPTWDESKEHIQKHNIVSWLKPDNLSHTFFRHFVSQHRSTVFKCNLCNYLYGTWFHAIDHLKDSRHLKNWNLTSASTAKYTHYENSDEQFNQLICNRIFIGDSKLYHCHVCNLSFNNFQDTISHIDSIEHKNLLLRDTNLIFQFKSQIPKHLTWLTTSNMFIVMKDKIYCKICDVYFTELSEITPHMATHKTVQQETNPNKNQQKEIQKDSQSKQNPMNINQKSIPISQCKLKIPQYLHWVITGHKVLVTHLNLYCTICKKLLTNNSAVECHLQKHLESSWQKVHLPAGYPTEPPPPGTEISRTLGKSRWNDITTDNKSPTKTETNITRTSGKTRWNDISDNNSKIQTIDLTDDTKDNNLSLTKCKLKIPDNLKWIINAHNVVLNEKYIYCTICKKSMYDNTSVENHLKKHLNPAWQKIHLPTGSMEKMQITDSSSSSSSLSSPSVSGTTKRTATNSIDTEQTKIQKIDSMNSKSTFKNVGNSIQIVPQLSGNSGNHPPVLLTANASKIKPRPSINTRPNLVDLMKQSIPSLLINSLPTPPIQWTTENKSNNSNSNSKINQDCQITVEKIKPKPPMNSFLVSKPPMKPLINPSTNPMDKNVINQQPSHFNNFSPNPETLNNYPMNQQISNNHQQTSINQLNSDNFRNPFIKSHQQSSNQTLKRTPQLPSQNHLLNTTIMTKLHKANYLSFTKNEIYIMSTEKKRKIILSSCLSFFVKYAQEYFIYCVVCEKSMPYNLQNIYEHWCSMQHNEYLTKLEDDDKQFNNYPNQFSCLALSKEFMVDNQSSSSESATNLKLFTCCACDITVPDQDAMLQQHFQCEKHRMNVERFKRHSEEICKEIFPLVESSWYCIEKYSCWPCEKLFSSEILFAEHLENKKHLNILQAMNIDERKNYYFDSCAVCGLLWFGDCNEYTKHCHQDNIHKDLTRNIEDRIDFMPEEVNYLFSSLENVISELMSEVDKVRFDQGKESELIRSLELAVRRKFPEAKAYPFGSRVTGLGLMNSDIDIFLDCGK